MAAVIRKSYSCFFVKKRIQMMSFRNHGLHGLNGFFLTQRHRVTQSGCKIGITLPLLSIFHKIAIVADYV